MNNPSTPAVVFGGGINPLGIVRNLGREGIRVYCVLEGRDPILYSRYCSKYFIVPRFTEHTNRIGSFLSRLARGLKTRPIVFSTDDITTMVLSELQYQMNDRYLFVVPRKEVADILIDKSKFYESLMKHGIQHPKVMAPSSLVEVPATGRELGYPVFVRPCLSQKFSKAFGGKGFVAKNQIELVEYYQLASRNKVDVMFQEIIPGPAANVFGIAGFLDRHSRPLALFGYHRIRGWPPMFGNSCLMESVALARLNSLKELIITYLSRLGYYGIFDAEFKQDPRDGGHKLLEINARSWWQNSLPTRCGVNILLTAYLDAIGEKPEDCRDYETGVSWTNSFEDICSSLATNVIMTRSWIRSFANLKDYAFFDFNDPGPSASNVLFALGVFGPTGRLINRQMLKRFMYHAVPL